MGAQKTVAAIPRKQGKIVNKLSPKTAPFATNGNGKNHVSSEQEDYKMILHVLTEVKKGNFKVRMPIDKYGVQGKVYDTLNDIISLNEQMMLEFTRAGNIIGKEGKLTQRIESPSAKGSWGTGVDSLNSLISDLVHPTIEIAHGFSSVAKGNLSEQMPLEIGGHNLKGEFAR